MVLATTSLLVVESLGSVASDRARDACFYTAIASWAACGLFLNFADVWGSRSDFSAGVFMLYLFVIVGMVEAYLTLPIITDYFGRRASSPDVEHGAPAGTTLLLLAKGQSSSSEPADPSSPAKPRLAYLDNIKSFLTFVVVMHHVICSLGPAQCYINGHLPAPSPPCAPSFFRNTTFVLTTSPKAEYRTCLATHPPPSTKCFGITFFEKVFSGYVLALNQSYFMAFFFLISAYFVPTSLDRKGQFAFVADKLKRLGIPFVVWWFCLGPLSLWMVYGLQKQHYNYAPAGGPPWFIGCLLSFNLFYAFIAGGKETAWKVAPPQVTTCFAVAFGVGIVMSNFKSGMGSPMMYEDFLNVPGGIFSLIWYLIFFIAGIVARRNNWLDAVSELPYKQVKFCVASATLLALALFYYCIATAYWGSKSYARESTALFKGVMPMAIIISELVIFQRCFNRGGSIPKFFSDAAYTVYLIHPFTVLLFTYSYTSILTAAGTEVADLRSSPYITDVRAYLVTPNSAGEAEGIMWGGFFYVLFTVELVTWPLAWLICKAPLFNRVL